MEYNALFFLNSALLGVGLAMDAFSVSLANGLSETSMPKTKMCQIAGVFAGFQALMPMVGWVCVHTITEYFQAFRKFIPWIALILLCYIGGQLLVSGVRNKDALTESMDMGLRALLIEGVATSIDALSVGFTIADYNCPMALVCSLIIAAVTFIICMCGLVLGKKFGTKIAGKAEILGGIILIAIGVEIFLSNIF